MSNVATAPASTGKKRSVWGIIGNILLITAGVILPCITLGIEISSSMSASSFVDPIPTWFHILLVASVPVINLTVWLQLRRPASKYDKALLIAIYFSVGICLVYTLSYLPMVPLGFMLTIVGLGFLPLSPLLALIASLILMRKYKKQLKHQYTDSPELKLFKRNYLGLIGAISIMLMLEVPGMINNYGLHLYQSENSQTRESGIKLLRHWGSESELLRSCYPRSMQIFDLSSLLYKKSTPRDFSLIRVPNSAPYQAARSAFYQVTGKSFNEFPAPSSRARNNAIVTRRFDFDQGNQRVGGRLNQLWLQSSRIDASIDTKASLAYLEWTFEYKNKSSVLAEARKEIQLPPNAVISRVTLWVNGEEREAAIASKQKTTSAYRSVVASQRDPILVTLSGKDRALIQMFPVPANGGIMKARIGITLPLDLNKPKKAILVLPKINNRNFNIEESFKHSVWVDSKHTNEINLNSESERKNALMFSKSNQISHVRFQDKSFYFTVDQATPTLISYAKLANEVQSGNVMQSVKQTLSKTKSSFDKIIIVLDGSASMQKYIRSVIEAIKQFSSETKIEFILSGDQAHVLHPLAKLDTKAKSRLVRRLQSYSFSGGANNILGLELATEHSLADQNKDERTAIVWIHSPQPYLLKSMSHLNQFWQRKKNPVSLFYVPTEAGVNKIIQAMPKTVPANYANPYLSLNKSLTNLFEKLTGHRESTSRHYQLVKPSKAQESIHHSSLHLVRLWANAKITSLLSLDSAEDRKRALELSTKFRLVTAVSGAVVLETDNQYDQFGLKKPNLSSDMVPSIPEPSTWALLILTLIGFIFVVLTNKNKQI